MRTQRKTVHILIYNLPQNEDPSERSGQTWGLLPGTTVMAPVQNPHSFLQRQDSSEPSSLSNTPCLDILLSENILGHEKQPEDTVWVQQTLKQVR